MARPLIEIKNLSYSTPDGRLLQRNLNVSLSSGEMLLISGANGCGKSTLLKVLLGKHQTYEGKFDCPYPLREIEYIPQLENTEIHFPLRLKDVLTVSRLAKFDRKAVLNLGLLSGEQMNAAWNSASGGERKRTLLTRALLRYPKLLVLDEPMNHLDSASRRAVIAAMADFLSDQLQDRAIVMVCHQGLDGDEAGRFKVLPLDLDAERQREGLYVRDA